MMGFLLMIFLTAGFAIAGCLAQQASSNKSILGDEEMKNTDARFALEAWNSCNEVGKEAPTGSPRMADCADLKCPNPNAEASLCNVTQKVQDSDNSLGVGHKFPIGDFNSSADVDNYAVEKEKYLGSLCKRNDNNVTWYFWKIMLKNGNLDTRKTICPENGKKVNKTVWGTKFPCFGEGCMNQPLMYRNASHVDNRNPSSPASLTGGFYGTYDINNATLVSSNGTAIGPNNSYYEVSWKKTNKTANKNSSWELSFKLTTSPNYPWLMLYLRADETTGINGGYRHDGRGIMNALSLPQSPYFKVKLTLNIIKGGGGSSQFYLSDIGSCWKNNGKPCDGDATTDVTRYSEMIINPSAGPSCSRGNKRACPPYHIDSTTRQKIYKNDSANFPYEAYHLYCAPGNAQHLDDTVNRCDPYSNPQAQELVQLLPHPQWHKYGYPSSSSKEDVGWEVTGPKTWELDIGMLSDRLYFYQDPDTEPAKRIWTSIHVGTEIYSIGSTRPTTAEWTVSDFDVVVTK